MQHTDPEREDEFIEWCQTKFVEITEGRDYIRGTKTKEETEANIGDNENDGVDGDEEKGNWIELGALLKYLSQGREPTK